MKEKIVDITNKNALFSPIIRHSTSYINLNLFKKHCKHDNEI